MKFPIPVLTLAFLAIGGVCAQDITGRWIGVAETTDESGANRMERQTLEIKNEDGKLTGLLVSRSGKAAFPSKFNKTRGSLICWGFCHWMGENTCDGSLSSKTAIWWAHSPPCTIIPRSGSMIALAR